MPSQVTIINGALRKLGAGRITTIEDESEQGRVANDTYETYRDAVLSDAPWDFAKELAALSVNTVAPAWKFANAFDLPGDPYCLRVLEVENDSETPWEVIGREIHTNLGAPLNIVYIAQITEEAFYPALFIEALEARLALEWAETLTKQSSVQSAMGVLYQEKLDIARTVDAGQAGLQEDTSSGSWIDSRF